MPHFFRQVAGMTTRQTNHIAFVGTLMIDGSINALRIEIFSCLKPWPSEKRQREVNRYLMPFDDMVLWHSGRNDLGILAERYRIIQKTPRGLEFAHVKRVMILCNAAAEPTAATEAWWF